MKVIHYLLSQTVRLERLISYQQVLEVKLILILLLLVTPSLSMKVIQFYMNLLAELLMYFITTLRVILSIFTTNELL